MEIRHLVDSSQPTDQRAGDVSDNSNQSSAPDHEACSSTIITNEDHEPSNNASTGPQVAAVPGDPDATTRASSRTDQQPICDNNNATPPPPPPAFIDVSDDTSLPPSNQEPYHRAESPPRSHHVAALPPPPLSSSSSSLSGLFTADSGSLHAPASSSSFSVDLSIDTDSSSDADSALGSFRAQSSSMSATSSIFDFVEEHGRTWHRYKEGKYFMPNDISEQERLELQHSISLRLLGALHLAPVARPHRVLDLGTGTGIWAIDFANEHPEADVLGTDLSPIQPEYVPPNCRFEVDDAEDEWVFHAPFDYIHSRYMSGSFGDFPALFRACYQNLRPGGWVEFQDYVVKLRAVDDSLRGTALERWSDLVIEGVRRMGKNANACLRYKTQLQEAGYVDVREERFALPGNPWARGEDQKILGTMQMENILDGLHGFSIGLFTKMLGMSVQEVELLLVDVRKDLRNTKIHFYYLVYVVYGRKPF